MILLSSNELKLPVESLGEHPETKIKITGHACYKGNWETNLNLSNKRAREVYDFLICNKASPDRMFFMGREAQCLLPLMITKKISEKTEEWKYLF